MNAIIEETALPTTTSDPDVEPTWVEGKALTPRLDKREYEYDDEPAAEDAWDGRNSMRSGASADDTDDARSLARTFGVKSRNGNSLRHHASFDSSFRHSMPTSKMLSIGTAGDFHHAAPAVPPKSPARHQADTTSLDQHSLSEFGAGPSSRQRPLSAMAFTTGGRYMHDSAEAGPSRYMQMDVDPSSFSHDGSDSETPRSTTPASSFYAQPRRKIPMHIGNRSSSLLDRTDVHTDDAYSTPPRSDRLPRSSDEGFDSGSNSTGSQSFSSQAPLPVDANLRSMPGVVGLGEGWAGGPQGQNKKRRLWFRRKSKSNIKAEEDPLALWSIQESGVEGGIGKTAPKKGVFKEAWNRSMNKLGSMPALASLDRMDNSTGGGIKGFFSRSKLDLVEDKSGTKRPPANVDEAQAREKKEKRRTVAFFGTSKSQVELTTPKQKPTATIPVQQPVPQSPPSPSPPSRAGMLQADSPDLSKSDFSFMTPLKTDITPRDNRRLSAPLSAPATPGGLPPPWRPQSFIIPRPDASTPAPRPFSRHEERAITEEPEAMEGLEQSIPSLTEGPQTSISSAGIDTPRTNSAGATSLKHKLSARFVPLQDESFSSSDHGEVQNQIRPKSSLARSITPHLSAPHNDSTPGLDTLQDWAAEGKRPLSRAFRPAQDAPPPFPEPVRSQTPNWMTMGFIDRIKQALTITPAGEDNNAMTPRRSATTPVPSMQLGETPVHKDLPDLPSRTSTPIMPGAYPAESPIEIHHERSLPPSPYDITQAVAREMLATPSPSRPSSRAEPRKRGLSGDLWSKRLGRIQENDATDNTPRPTSRASSRMEKRNSYAAFAGRLGFGALRRNSSGAATVLADSSDIERANLTPRGLPEGVSPFVPSASSVLPLTVPDFGADDLGLDDILDEERRMTLVRDLEAALPLPPARPEPMSPSTIASQPTTLSSGSDATVLAPAAELSEDGRLGHKSHPSTSTTATFDLDELMTPTQLRRSFERDMEGRRGSHHSGSSGSAAALALLEGDRGFTRHQWPTRKHTRNTSMGSIGELAAGIMNNNIKPTGQNDAKRGSMIIDVEDEDEYKIREREARAMSFASQVSDLSSAMSFDDEEAVPMSATRVALVQQLKTRQMSLGGEIRV